MIIDHYLGVLAVIPAVGAMGFALRHYADEIILFVLGFVSKETLENAMDKLDALEKSEIEKVAAIPAQPRGAFQSPTDPGPAPKL
jgi:hypothetical protein